MSQMQPGGALSTETARNTNLNTANYSATILATNAQGIPAALLNNDSFASVGMATNDIRVNGMGITIRYVIDRMATTAGPCTPSTCTMANQQVFGGASNEAPKPSPPVQPIFRMTLKVSGPRNTVSYFQSIAL